MTILDGLMSKQAHHYSEEEKQLVGELRNQRETCKFSATLLGRPQSLDIFMQFLFLINN